MLRKRIYAGPPSSSPYKKPRSSASSTSAYLIPKIGNTFSVMQKGAVGETKAVDIATGTKNLNTTLDITIINPIQQGAGPSQRVGRRVALKKLIIRGSYGVLRDGQAQVERHRICVIYDRQPQATLPTINDLWQLTDQVGNTTPGDSWSPNNLNNSRRFRVLMDKRWAVAQPQVAAGDTTFLQNANEHDIQFKLDEFVDLKGLEVDFIGNANPMQIANYATGALYLITMGSVAAGAECFNLQVQTRVKFTDA